MACVITRVSEIDLGVDISDPDDSKLRDLGSKFSTTTVLEMSSRRGSRFSAAASRDRWFEGGWALDEAVLTELDVRVVAIFCIGGLRASSLLASLKASARLDIRGQRCSGFFCRARNTIFSNCSGISGRK